MTEVDFFLLMKAKLMLGQQYSRGSRSRRASKVAVMHSLSRLLFDWVVIAGLTLSGKEHHTHAVSMVSSSYLIISNGQFAIYPLLFLIFPHWQIYLKFAFSHWSYIQLY